MSDNAPHEHLELRLVTADFRIRAANLDAATQALRDNAQRWRDWTVRRNEKLASRGKPLLDVPSTVVESVEAVFRDLGFVIGHDRAGGLRLTGFKGNHEDLGLIIDALRAVEKQVESRSSLTWEVSDGSAWEDRFFRKQMRVRDFSGPLDMM